MLGGGGKTLSHHLVYSAKDPGYLLWACGALCEVWVWSLQFKNKQREKQRQKMLAERALLKQVRAWFL